MGNKRVLRNKKTKLRKRRVFGVILILVLIVICIVISNKNNKVKNDNNPESISEIKEKTNQAKREELSEMNERERMEKYWSIFINHIENNEYEEAYGLLYDDFKKNYFPTLDDFVQYAKKTFPNMINIQYTNIERNGDIYVLWINISDLLNGGANDKKEMNVVIKENGLNDFVLSFSVI